MRLIDMLEDCDDVQEVYLTVKSLMRLQRLSDGAC